MPRLLRAELTRVFGRRASFLGTIALSLLVLALAIVFYDPDNGGDALNVYAGAASFAAVFGVAIAGALSGSYDIANGTMRYLVLTGVSRTQLALVRILGIMVATLPVAAIILVVSIVAAGSQDPAPDGTEIANTVWQVVSTVWVWGVVSAAIGMLVRSNGPAIAVSIVLFVGGSIITAVVNTQISETLSNYLLPSAFAQVSDLADKGSDYEISLATGGLVLVAWLAAFVVLAVARVRRDEY